MQTITKLQMDANKNVEGAAKKGSHQPPDGASGKMMRVVFVSLLLDLVAFAMILPLFPVLLDYYGRMDQGGLYDTLQSSVNGFRAMVGAPDTPKWNAVLFGGLIGSMFSFLQFLVAPLMGAASDVYGRKPLMILSAVGIAMSYALWAVSSTFTIFVIARIVAGVSKGNISLSTAIVADVAPPEKRGKGMALIGIAFSIGFLIGPMIGAYFSAQSKGQEGMFFVTPALFALLLATLDVLFLIFFMKETLPLERRAKKTENVIAQAISLINPVALFKFSAVRNISKEDVGVLRQVGVVYFLYLFLYSGLEFTLTFLTYNRFNFNSMDQGRMFFVIGITMIIVQGGIVRRFPPGKEISFAMRGLVVLIPSFLIIGVAHSKKLLYVGIVLYSFASAIVVPCLTSLVSSYGTQDQKGTVMGIFRSLGAMARALGPVLACTIYWCFGALACYTLGAVALIVPCVLLARVKVTHTD